MSNSKPPPYLMADYNYSVKYHHHPYIHNPKDDHKAKSNIFFSFFIIIICISFFYILNYHYSSLSFNNNHNSNPYIMLINNNIFWFFMSNTLILIIAADYEAFSSSKNNHPHPHHHQDLYEEYVKHTHTRSLNTHNYNYALTNYYPKSHHHQQLLHHDDDDKSSNSTIPPPKQELHKYPSNEIIIETIPERVLEIVPQNNDIHHAKKPSPSPSPSSSSDEKKKAVQDDIDHSRHKDTTSSSQICEVEKKTMVYPVGRSVGRSKSDRHDHGRVMKRVVIDESKNRVIRRSETMIKNNKEEADQELLEDQNKNNEFSSMTNEELNRRVEEFIQRFNRQIRLQAAQNY